MSCSVDLRRFPAAKRRFVINPYLTVIYCGDDEVIIKHGSRSRFSCVIRDAERSNLLGRILRNLRAPASLEGLCNRGLILGTELENAAELVTYLEREGVLVDPEYDLVGIYLNGLLGGATPISQARVGIVGVGYLGSRIACQLAQLGVGDLVLLEDRRVERETRDRRYFELSPEFVRDGVPYAECTRLDLERRGYSRAVTVEARLDDGDELHRLAGEVDFIVAALEYFSSHTLHAVNAVAVRSEKPWISVYMDGSEASVGPIYVPGETCCYNEFEIQHEATLSGMKDSYLLYKEEVDGETVRTAHLVIGPYLAMASGLATTGVMRFLTTGRSFLVERCNRIDFERLSVDYEQVFRLPRCPACAQQRPPPRQPFM
jgi:bacteriocin biosynthesis cyclodehydratase domain-containing protein